MGLYTQVHIHPDAYTHVYRAYTFKRAVTGTFINVQTPKHTCTLRTHPNRPVWVYSHTFRSVHTDAEDAHSQKGRYVHTRPDA